MSSSTLNDSFAAAVRMYRRSKEQSTEECARELGIGRTSLMNIENHRANPTLETVEAIAQSMGCDPLTLLGGKSGADCVTALLLMNCLEGGERFSLDTLKQAADLLQEAVGLLLDARRACERERQQSPDEP